MSSHLVQRRHPVQNLVSNHKTSSLRISSPDRKRRCDYRYSSFNSCSGIASIIFTFYLVVPVHSYTPVDIKLDEKAKQLHRIDSFNILAYTFLLILTVCTIWLFKRRRARFLHETGLAIIYGLIIGAIIRYVGDTNSSFTHMSVAPDRNETFDAPPDSVHVPLEVKDKPGDSSHKINKTYVYIFRGELAARITGQHDISHKATFDPEIFFNIILPPIIFNAGYSLKKRFFFRNIVTQLSLPQVRTVTTITVTIEVAGAIMTYAFLGTTISCFAVGVIMYGFVSLIPSLGFNFNDCLYFGAITSATDPVTILAIFNDLHVDVTLYALVFGESILNDAVAITLAESIDKFEQVTQGGDQLKAAGQAVANFCSSFVTSLFLGSFVGCCTALLTKFTRLQDFPLLEASLFVLMSYSTFLMAEVLEFSGIVAVLFCGICQAHYTMNNLSEESKAQTKQFCELLNFMAENFIFTYIGVSMFTYPTHNWKFSFIIMAFIALFAGRALSVYPLSMLLNLGRHNKIPRNFQHVLFISGLRGAMAFALALRNTLTESRQVMLTATSFIVIVTVVFIGGSTNSLLQVLEIPVGVDESEQEMLSIRASTSRSFDDDDDGNVTPGGTPIDPAARRSPYEKAWLVRIWKNFDTKFMKPLLTNSRPTLIETMPQFCLPVSSLLTTAEQLDDNHFKRMSNGTEYDSDDDGLVYRQQQRQLRLQLQQEQMAGANSSSRTATNGSMDVIVTTVRPRVGSSRNVISSSLEGGLNGSTEKF